MWASNNNSGNLWMQESADGRKPAQVTKVGYPRDAGIQQQTAGIGGMQESADGRKPTQATEYGYLRDAGIQQPSTGFSGCRNPRMTRIYTEDRTTYSGDPQIIGIHGRQDEKCLGMGSGYGHQEPTRFRGKNRGCSSRDTVTRNQRGSEGRTEGAVLRIRSPGTNGVPREETEGAVLRIRSPRTNGVPKGKAWCISVVNKARTSVERVVVTRSLRIRVDHKPPKNSERKPRCSERGVNESVSGSLITDPEEHVSERVVWREYSNGNVL